MARVLMWIVILLGAAACGGSGGSGGSSEGAGYTPENGNLHLIDQAANGFAIYRSGAPDQGAFKEWCRLGVSEVMVLSGNAGAYEEAWGADCPDLQVVYNEEQDASTPLTVGFLRSFDQWVTHAQAQGKKILFRCDCGCHRTGRLAAYYEMKYMGYSEAAAEQDMLEYGKDMDGYPELFAQVQALAEYLQGQPCSQGSECPQP